MATARKIDLIEKVQRALDTVRPHLQADGGDVEVVDITEDLVLQIRWMGACKTCHMTAMTMKAGIEEVVKQQVFEICRIEAVDQET